MNGLVNYHAGISAEASVERRYAERGFSKCASRWRGRAGEIDLIVQDAETTVFVEVKKARDFATAAARLSQRQMARIAQSAMDFLGSMPEGLNSNARIDVALVDAQGSVEILENAFGQ